MLYNQSKLFLCSFMFSVKCTKLWRYINQRSSIRVHGFCTFPILKLPLHRQRLWPETFHYLSRWQRHSEQTYPVLVIGALHSQSPLTCENRYHNFSFNLITVAEGPSTSVRFFSEEHSSQYALHARCVMTSAYRLLFWRSNRIQI